MPHTRPRAGKFIVGVVVAAVLGAVVTVASAWAFAGLSHYRARPPLRSWNGGPGDPPLATVPQGKYIVAVFIDLGPGVRRYTQILITNSHSADDRRFDDRGRLPGSLVARVERRFAGRVPDPRAPLIVEERAGWPAPALSHEVEIGPSPFSVVQPAINVHWGIDLDTDINPGRLMSLSGFGDGDRPRALPLRPEWPGFAINTALYGAIAYLVLFGAGTLRRARRRRRGLCPHCGYDRRGLGADSLCPECGHATPLRA